MESYHLGLIDKADLLVSNEIGDIFYSVGKVSDTIPEICLGLQNILEMFIEKPSLLSMTENRIHKFLTKSLPILVEVILKRNNKSVHEIHVVQALRTVVKFLTLSCVQTIGELTILRNMILLNQYHQHLKFTHMKHIRSTLHYPISPTHQFDGFYNTYGHVSIAIKNDKYIYFWPDDWERELGGFKAICHYIRIFNNISTLNSHSTTAINTNVSINSKSSDMITTTATTSGTSAASDRLTEWEYIDGLVTEYYPDTDEYLIQIESYSYPSNTTTTTNATKSTTTATVSKDDRVSISRVTINGDDTQSDSTLSTQTPEDKNTSSSSNKKTIRVNLRTTHHIWIDINYKHILLSQYHMHTNTYTSTGASTHMVTDSISNTTPIHTNIYHEYKQRRLSAIEQKLTFTPADEGLYIRIWWPRYKKYFYGRIISYDPSLQEHTVIYEDSDIKAYNMLSKEFDIINSIPDEVSKAVMACETDAQKAHLVAVWHQEYIQQQLQNTYTSSSPSSTSSSLQIGGMKSTSGVVTSSTSSKVESAQTTVEGETVYTYIIKPPPTSSTTISLYQLQFIELFFQYHGRDNINEHYNNTAISAPTCTQIFLYLNMLYYIRHYIHKHILMSMVIDVRAMIPVAISRYDDSHIKELQPPILEDIFILFKELSMMVVTYSATNSPIGVNTNTNTNISMSFRTQPQQQQASVSSTNNNETSESVSMISITSLTTQQVLDSLDDLRCLLAWKLLTSSILQKRYLGLSMIKDMIDIISPKIVPYTIKRSHMLLSTCSGNTMNNSSGSNSSSSSGINRYNPAITPQMNTINTLKNKIFITLTQMESYIINHHIIEELLGVQIHQDLIAKSDILFVFLAHRRQLTEAHLLLLWNASKGVHETIVRVLYHLILLLIPILEPNLRLYLFQLIADTSCIDYNEQFLYLIKNYTTQYLNIDRKESIQSQQTIGGSIQSSIPSGNVPDREQEMVLRQSYDMSDPLNSSRQAENANSTNTVRFSPRDTRLSQDTSSSPLYNPPLSPTSQGGSVTLTSPSVSTNTAITSTRSTFSRPRMMTSSASTSTNGVTMTTVSDTIYHKKWLGFTLLWNYIQDPLVSTESNNIYTMIHTTTTLIDLSISLIMELLNEEFFEEKEYIIQLCLDNVQVGISVPISLHLLRRILATYPLPSKSWFNPRSSGAAKLPTLDTQIEKLNKQYNVIALFFIDLDRYHRLVLEQIIGQNMSEMNVSGQMSSDNSRFPLYATTDTTTTTATAPIDPYSSIKSPHRRNTMNSAFTYPSLPQTTSTSSSAAAISTNIMNGNTTTTVPLTTPIIPVDSKWNESHWYIQGRYSRVTHLRAMQERLDFLTFIVSKSTITLSESHVLLLWKSSCEQAISLESMDICMNWFSTLFAWENKPLSTLIALLTQENDLIHTSQPSKLAFLNTSMRTVDGSSNTSSTPTNTSKYDPTTTTSPTNQLLSDIIDFPEYNTVFDDNALISLFKNHVILWSTKYDIVPIFTRYPVASFCLKLFMLVNIYTKNIKVDMVEGLWVRSGTLYGLGLLWRMTLDTTHSIVSEAVMRLLIELHHRLPLKSRHNETIRGYLLKTCFQQLSISIQSLHTGSPPPTTPMGYPMAPPNSSLRQNSVSSVGSGGSFGRSRSPSAIENEVYTRGLSHRSMSNDLTLTTATATTATSPLMNTQIISADINTAASVEDRKSIISSFTTTTVKSTPISHDWFNDDINYLDNTVISRRIIRLIILLKLYIKRFHQTPVQLYTIQIYAGEDDTVSLTLTLKSTDTIGHIRKLVSAHYNESANSLLLCKYHKASQLIHLGINYTEKFENDNVTLKQSKLQYQDSLTVRKKELAPSKVSSPDTSNKPNINGVSNIQFEDKITPQDLDGDLIPFFRPLIWLPPDIATVKNKMSSSSSMSSDTTNSTTSGGISQYMSPIINTIEDKRAMKNMIYTLPTWPYPSHIDVTFATTYNPHTSSQGTPSPQNPSDSDTNHENKLFEYLGNNLKNSYEYIDQLLTMLDGYLSMENNNQLILVEQFDFSSAVWEVIRSLPTHSVLMKQIRELSFSPHNTTTTASSASSISQASSSSSSSTIVTSSVIYQLFDITCPYRLLYILQILDAFLSTENDLRANISPKNISKKMTEWSIKFLNMGGVEHLLSLFLKLQTKDKEKERQLSSSSKSMDSTEPIQTNSEQKVTDNFVSTDLPVAPRKDQVWDPTTAVTSTTIDATVDTTTINKEPDDVSKNDVYVLIQTLLVRTLHRFLLLDPLYDIWQPESICMYYHRAQRYALYNPDCRPQMLPHGTVITFFQKKSIISVLLERVYHITQLYYTHEITAISLKTFVENTFVLIFGLLLAFDDGLSIFQSIHKKAWIKLPYDNANITSTRDMNKTTASSAISTGFSSTTSSFSSSSTSSSSSVSLLELVIHSLIITMPDIYVRNSVCRRIFEFGAVIWQVCSLQGHNLPIEKQMTRKHLFYTMFYSLIHTLDRISKYPIYLTLLSVHATTITSSDQCNYDNTINGNQSLHLEQLYTLLSIMTSIIYGPHNIGTNFIPNPMVTSFTPLSNILDPSILSSTSTKEDMKYKEPTWDILMTKLSAYFIEKLFTYRSTESFYSHQSDGTLLGMLRVIIALTYTGEKMIEYIGQYTYPSIPDNITTNSNDKQNRMNFISFLFHQCLFPSSHTPSSSTALTSSQSDSMSTQSHIKQTDALCQTAASRSLVYHILYILCHNNVANMIPLVTAMNADMFQHSSPADREVRGTTSAVSSSVVETTNMITQSHLPTLSTTPRLKSSPSSTYLLPKPIKWGYDPTEYIKDMGCSVGLSNQGGTCYMNALLQQLYHTEPLCEGILNTETSLFDTMPDQDLMVTDTTMEEPDEQLTEKDKKLKENENVLFQLQILFAFLRISQKQYYDTLPFCEVFKDYDGQPISLVEQKDINEFASMLFDKLEYNVHCKEVLSNTIQGSIVWQTRSMETSYHSEREEQFYMITAEVKNKPSLEESLDLFITDEFFTGDNKLEDPVAKRKVDAKRRCCIRKLPSTLIIHLKRFEFDLETLERKKVNDKMTFPMELNMFPYTEEGVAYKESKYKHHSKDTTTTTDSNPGIESESEVLLKTQSTIEDMTTDNIERLRLSKDDHEQEQEEVHVPTSQQNRKYSDVLSETSADDIDAVVGGGSLGQDFTHKITTGSSGSGSASHKKGGRRLPAIHEPSYYQYRLKGIVAHVGAIDRGHYYSYIKSHSTSTSTTNTTATTTTSERWYEYNDRHVTPFSIESIPAECFGGEETYTTANGTTATRMKQHNAYLLFYEKIPVVKSTLHHSTSHIGFSKSSMNLRRNMSNISLTNTMNTTDKTTLSHMTPPLVLIATTSNPVDTDISTLKEVTKKVETVNNMMLTDRQDGSDKVGMSIDIDDAAGSDNSSNKKSAKLATTLGGSIQNSATTNTTNIITSASTATIMSNNMNDVIIPPPVTLKRTSSMTQVLQCPSTGINSTVLQSVWEENKEFQMERYVYNKLHFKFLWKLLHIPLLTASSTANTITTTTMDSMNTGTQSGRKSNVLLYNTTINIPNITNTSTNEVMTPILTDPTIIELKKLLVVAALRFNIEIVARAKAKNCVIVFFERLEEIILADTSALSAERIIQELSLPNYFIRSHITDSIITSSGGISNARKTISSPLNSTKEMTTTPIKASPLSARRSIHLGTPLLSSKVSQQEYQYLYEMMHPWLFQMYLLCPISNTVRCMTRFLYTCFKCIRPLHVTKYLIVDSNDTTSQMKSFSHNNQSDTTTITTGKDSPTHISQKDSDIKSPNIRTTRSSSSPNKLNSSPKLVSLPLTPIPPSPQKLISTPTPRISARQSKVLINDIKYQEGKKYNCICAQFLNKMILLIEKTPPEFVYGREGYRHMVGLLVLISSLGYEEKQLLVALGTIYRLVSSYLCLNPSTNQLPVDEIRPSFELLSTLVCSAIVPTTPPPPTTTTTTTSITSTAITTPPPPSTTTMIYSPFLLPEISLSAGNESMTMIMSMDDLSAYMNKIYLDDSIHFEPLRTSVALQHISWSRKGNDVIKLLEFITERIIDCIMVTTGVNLSYRSYFRILNELLLNPYMDVKMGFYTTILPELLTKANHLASRMCPNDAEYLYALYKLFYRIGISSKDGHIFLLQYKEPLHRIYTVFYHNRRVKYVRVIESSPPQLPISSSNNSNNNKNNSGINTSIHTENIAFGLS